MLILHALDGTGPACKRWTPDGSCESYGLTTWWRPEERPLRGLLGLADTLAGLATDRDAIVVRGRLLDPSAARIMRRLHGEGASITDADRQWVCCDVDGVEVPAELREEVDGGGWNGRPMRVIEGPDGPRLAWVHLRTLIPSWLADAGCVWAWSGSAGRDEWRRIKAHVWFWLARPVCTATLYEWGSSVPVFDRAVQRAVQPIYTAAPLVEDGFPWRPAKWVTMIDGPPAVPPVGLLSLQDHTARAEAADAERRAESNRKVLRMTGREAMLRARAGSQLDRLVAHQVRQIARADDGDRHRTIVAAAVSVAKLARELGADDGRALDTIEAAGMVKKGDAAEMAAIVRMARGMA